MDELTKLNTLMELADQLEIQVRRAPAAAETGEHPGGSLVKLKGKEMLFLDPTASTSDQISAAAHALRGRAELQDQFIPPEIRELLDNDDE